MSTAEFGAPAGSLYQLPGTGSSADVAFDSPAGYETLSVLGEIGTVELEAVAGQVAYGTRCAPAVIARVVAPPGTLSVTPGQIFPTGPVAISGPASRATVAAWGGWATSYSSTGEGEVISAPAATPPVQFAPTIASLETRETPVTVSIADKLTPRTRTRVYSATGIQWTDQLNGVGMGAMKVPIVHPDAELLVRDTVVTFSYEGQERFSWFIESRVEDVVAEAGEGWVTVSGRGLLAWLDDAVVLPPEGLDPLSPESRAFNFAAQDAANLYAKDGMTLIQWGGSSGSAWATDPNRQGFPPEWPDPAGSWIWTHGGEAAANELGWFKSDFTVDEDKTYRLFITADNGFICWVDGIEVASAGITDSGGYTWQSATEVDLDLPAGVHTIGVRGQNLRRISSGGNPAGVLACIATIRRGKPHLIIARTDSAWDATSTAPMWLATDVMNSIVSEAMLRTTRPSMLTRNISWSPESQTLTRTTLSRNWNVGDSALTVALDLCESGLNVWVDPALNFYSREDRGYLRDDLKIEKAYSIVGMSVEEKYGGAARAYTRTRAGWVSIWNDKAANEIGYVKETSYSFPQVEEDDQGEDLARMATGTLTLSTSAATIESIVPRDDETQPWKGSKPYVHCRPGDIAMVPGPDGVERPARILSIAVSVDDAGMVTWSPELDVWTSEAILQAWDGFEPPLEAKPKAEPDRQEEVATQALTGYDSGGGQNAGAVRNSSPSRHRQPHVTRNGPHKERIFIGCEEPGINAGYQLWVDTCYEEGGGGGIS